MGFFRIQVTHSHGINTFFFIVLPKSIFIVLVALIIFFIYIDFILFNVLNIIAFFRS